MHLAKSLLDILYPISYLKNPSGSLEAELWTCLPGHRQGILQNDSKVQPKVEFCPATTTYYPEL